MYSLPYFKENDQEVVLQFMQQHPFVILAGSDENHSPVITQVPVLIEQRGDKLYLQAHIMRQTDHHRAFEKNPNVLAVFTSPHVYVSASWYENPYQGSTWNYMSVHARGKINFMEPDGLIALMKRFTLHFEKGNHQSPTVYDNLPDEYTSRLLNAIIGFEVEVESIENVFKLSQNRDEKSYHTIIGKLQQQGAEGAYIADEMKKRASQVFHQRDGSSV